MKKHLFVVAHPDDEVLGAGAFIYEAIRRGDQVAVAVLNTCDTTRYEKDTSQILGDMMKSHAILSTPENKIKLFPFGYIDSNFNNADHRKIVSADAIL